MSSKRHNNTTGGPRPEPLHGKQSVRKNHHVTDHDELEAAQSRIAFLESEVYKLSLYARGGNAGMKAVIEQADADRRRYEKRIADLEWQVESARLVLPAEITDLTPVVRPVETLFDQSQIDRQTAHTTIMGLTFSIREKGADDIRFISVAMEHPGTPDEALSAVYHRTIVAFSGTPSPQDIGNQTFPGLDTGQLLLVMVELSVYRTNEDNFNRRRKELFEEIWRDREKLNIDTVHNGHEYLSSLFTRVIKRTFERMEQRTIKMQSPTEFHRKGALIAEQRGRNTPGQKLS